MPIDVSYMMDVFSRDQANNQQALGQLFKEIQAHKVEYPYAYPMREIGPPPGWVDPPCRRRSRGA
eukprot:8397996-Karenia_brevis.AAC.1